MLDLFKRMQARKAPQPAADPKPNRPELHMTPDAPGVMRGIEQTGEELDGVEVDKRPLPDTAARSWRAGAGRVVDASGDVALSDDRGTAAREHLGPGRPDARRNNIAAAGNEAAPEVPVGEEHRTNARGQVAVSPSAPPERPRAGFTGADPTRRAEMQVAFTIRPFDKGIADHPGVIDRANQPNPTAARPPERRRLAGARPSPLGGGPTGMLPVDGHRNTIRRTPGPWDQSLVERTTADTAAASAQRAKGWRA